MKNHIISTGLILCVILLSTLNPSYSQKKITISDLKTYEYSIDSLPDFENESFEIQVNNKIIGRIELMQKNGDFKEIDPDKSNENYTEYILPYPHVSEFTLYQLRLITDIDTSLVKIKFVDNSSPAKTIDDQHIEALSDYFNKNMNFDKKRVIYAYDFNNNIALRGLYKVHLNKNNGNELVVERVNINQEKITPDKDVSFMVINVNRLIYDVHIADTLIIYESIASDLFDSFFSGNSVLLGNLLDQSLKFMNSLNSDKSETNFLQDEGILQETTHLLDSIIEFYQLYFNLKVLYINAFNPCYQFPPCQNIDYYSLVKKLNYIKFHAGSLNAKVESLSNKVKANQNILIDIKNTSTQLDEIEKQISAIESSDYIKANKTKEHVDLLINKELLTEKIHGYDLDELDSNIKELKKHLDQLSNLKQIIENLPSEDTIQKEVIFLNNIVSHNQTYLTDNVSLKGNILQLKIDIKSNDSITKIFGMPRYDNAPIELAIPIVWKPFVSFSSGVFAGLGNNLLNKTYDWQYVTYNNAVDTGNFTLIESGYTTKPFGLAALGNMELKACRNFGFGISTGVGLTIEKKPRFAYLLGGSLFIGDLRQFAVTAGITVMPVDHITETYQTIADNQVIYPDKIEEDYYKEIKTGIFISVSYTPFSYVKRK